MPQHLEPDAVERLIFCSLSRQTQSSVRESAPHALRYPRQDRPHHQIFHAPGYTNPNDGYPSSTQRRCLRFTGNGTVIGRTWMIMTTKILLSERTLPS